MPNESLDCILDISCNRAEHPHVLAHWHDRPSAGLLSKRIRQIVVSNLIHDLHSRRRFDPAKQVRKHDADERYCTRCLAEDSMGCSEISTSG